MTYVSFSIIVRIGRDISGVRHGDNGTPANLRSRKSGRRRNAHLLAARLRIDLAQPAEGGHWQWHLRTKLLRGLWFEGGAIPGVRTTLPVHLSAGDGIPVGLRSCSEQRH